MCRRARGCRPSYGAVSYALKSGARDAGLSSRQCGMTRTTRRAIAVLIGATVGAGLFLAGRLTSDTDDAPGTGYYSGLRQGESRGIQEGRALQLTDTLPRDAREAARTAFDTGYTAGANDVFGGYDGGWYVSRPYVITLTKGTGGITYDLSSRTMVHAGTEYFLCPHAHTICHRPHR